jgi:hypothetical protein
LGEERGDKKKKTPNKTPAKRQVAFAKSLHPLGLLWGSARIGCGHDVLNKITEGGNGIGKCVAKVPRYVIGAGDALKLFFPVSTYALNYITELGASESLKLLAIFSVTHRGFNKSSQLFLIPLPLSVILFNTS